MAEILVQFCIPKALLTLMEPACESPSETMNVNEAQVNAIWCAACALALMVPTKIPDTANAPAYTAICKLLSMPIFNSCEIVAFLKFHWLRPTAIYFLNILWFKITIPKATKMSVRVTSVA